MTRMKPLASLLTAALLASAMPLLHAADNNAKAARYYEDALTRYERKDFAGAVIQLKNALQVDKSMLPVHVLLGKALLANGEAAAAEIEFFEALRLGVDRAEIAIPLAQTLSIQGKQARIFEEPRLNPVGLPRETQLGLLLHRAGAYSDIGDPKNAIKSIDEARALNPTSPEPWIAEVPIRIRARQFAEAASAANQALVLAPNNAEAHYQKGSIFHLAGQLRLAVAEYDKALQINEGHFEARLARAGIRFDMQLDKESLADLKELESLNPLEPRRLYLRALHAERTGDAAGSKALLKEVTELLDPIPIEIIRYRTQVLMLNGMAHFGLQEYEKAKPYLEMAWKQQPASPLAKLLAQIAMLEPNVPRAVELLEGYLRGRPGDSQALLMLASAHIMQGRHTKAASLLQEALRAKDSPEFRTALGLSLMQGGQYSGGLVELEKAYRANPKNLHAGLSLVHGYLRNQGSNAKKALEVLGELAKAQPNSLAILVLKGQTRLQLRDYKGARLDFEKAAKADANLLEPQIGLARLDIIEKKFDAAKQRLSTAIKSRERQVDLLFEMATLSEASGKDDEALKWLESAVEASGARDVRANFAMVEWQLRKGKPQGAIAAAKLLLAKLPEDVDAMVALARAQLAASDQSGARATLVNASRRAGLDPTNQVAIARLQLAAKDTAGAVYGLEKALTTSPQDIDAQTLMTVSEMRLGEFDKAERRARGLIAAHPKRALGYKLLADINFARERAPAALEAIRQAHAIEASSETSLAVFNALVSNKSTPAAHEHAKAWLQRYPRDMLVGKALAYSLMKVGDLKGARARFEALLKLNPADLEVLNNLATVLSRQGDPAALTFAEQALAKSPGNPLVLDTVGWANLLAGKKDRALQILRDARLRDPSHPEIRYHLAAALASAGRTAEARDELQVALKSDDKRLESFAEAKALLATLK